MLLNLKSTSGKSCHGIFLAGIFNCILSSGIAVAAPSRVTSVSACRNTVQIGIAAADGYPSLQYATPNDLGKAYQKFRTAARAGHTKAMFFVGEAAYFGIGTPHELTQAQKYLSV